MKESALALLCMQRHSWEQGICMQAFYEQGEGDVVIRLAKEAAYRALPDGRMAILGDGNAVTDPCCVGETLAWAARETGDPDLTAALAALREWALHRAPRNDEGLVYHVTNAPQIWVDSMYMLPPFLAAIGEGEEALRQMLGYDRLLRAPSTGLMAHRWDDGAGCFQREDHWGVGNGWALAGYARMISLLPEHSAVLAERAVTLLDALLPWMRPDGAFHDVVDDPSTFVEVNLSQMAAYTILRGVREGWLDRRYLPAARTMRQAALSRVDAYGVVRQVCGAPSFDKPGAAPEAQAFLLMMENEWKRLNME